MVGCDPKVPVIFREDTAWEYFYCDRLSVDTAFAEAVRTSVSIGIQKRVR